MSTIQVWWYFLKYFFNPVSPVCRRSWNGKKKWGGVLTKELKDTVHRPEAKSTPSVLRLVCKADPCANTLDAAQLKLPAT